MFTSFTIYSKSSKIAIGRGPSPDITSLFPGHPNINEEWKIIKNKKSFIREEYEH